MDDHIEKSTQDRDHEITTIQLGVENALEVGQTLEQSDQRQRSSSRYEIVPAEWRLEGGGNISVQIVDTSSQQHDITDCEKVHLTSSYTINSFLTSETTPEILTIDAGCEDNAQEIFDERINNKVPSNKSRSLSEMYIKFKHLINFRRRALQPVTSYIREFEERVLDLEASGLSLDQMILSFYLLQGCTQDIPDSKAVTFLPEFKYNKNASANDPIGLNASDIDGNASDDIEAVSGEFLYAHLLESLIRSDHEVNEDLKNISFIEQNNDLEDVKVIDNNDNKESKKGELFSIEETSKKKGEMFSIEETTKCVINAATSLAEATTIIKATLDKVQDITLAATVHEPMEKATKAVENAAASLNQLVLPWRNTCHISSRGEGEWYKMSLKKRRNEEREGQEGEGGGSEFVMKIEPEIDYSLQAASPEEEMEDNENIKDDIDHDFVPKQKPVRKLKRLKKFRKNQLLKRKIRRKLMEEPGTIIDSDGKKEYPCGECEYIAGDFYRLKRHQNSVHLGIKFPCDQCTFAASDSSGLTRHKKSKHEGYRYLCDKCEYAATTSSDLKRHKNSRHEGIRHPCDECDYSATQASNLTQHKKSKHQGVRYLCDQCPYAATAPSDLTRHKKCKHQSIFECNLCDFVINNEVKLKHHKKRHHDGYSCDHCDFVTPIRNNLRYHKRSKHDGSKFLCDQCEYSTINSSNLIRHKRTNHAVEMDAKSLAAAAVMKGRLHNHNHTLDEKNGLLYGHQNQEEIETSPPSLLAANRRLEGRRGEIKPVSPASIGTGITIQYPGSRERDIKDGIHLPPSSTPNHLHTQQPTPYQPNPGHSHRSSARQLTDNNKRLTASLAYPSPASAVLYRHQHNQAIASSTVGGHLSQASLYSSANTSFRSTMTSLVPDSKEETGSNGVLAATAMSHFFPVKPSYNPYIQ